MTILKEAVNEQGAAKVGFFGDPGSGKTVTAALMLLALSKKFRDGAPVAMYDTERGSDFLIPIFKTEGVKLLVNKDRSFVGLMNTLHEAEKMQCSAFLADSVTHAWVEIVDSYCAKKHINRPEFQHWKDIKKQWQELPDYYLNCPLDVSVNGRAGFEYEYQESVDRPGKKELIKGDSKMRVEGQFGYEPHLLIEMERIRETGGEHVGGRFIHRAHVLKDRSWTLNGKHFDFADRDVYKKGDYMKVYEAFQSHFEFMNIGGHKPVVASNSESLFPNGNSEYYVRDQEKKICLEENLATMQLLWPGQDATSKRLRINVMDKVWGTRAWAAVENLPLEKVQFGLRVLREFEDRAKSAEAMETEDAVLRLLQTAKDAVECGLAKDTPKEQDPLSGYDVSKSVKAATAPSQINLPPPPPPEHEEKDTELMEIEAVRSNGSLFLTGSGTFELKEDIKKLGGRWNKERKAWAIPPGKQPELATLCSAKKIGLVTELAS